MPTTLSARSMSDLAPPPLTGERVVTLLRTSHFLRTVPAPVIERLAARAAPRALVVGERLWREGDRAVGFHVIVNGLVTVRRSLASGAEVIVAIFGSRENVGDTAALEGGRYPAEAVVTSDTATVIRLNAQRVLDVGTSALVALGDALEHVASRTAVIGFASYTRRDCRLAILKDFDAPWAAAHARLAALEPSGYTRIGPAVRHVTALLDRQPARRKLLVLLSDGKPTDYDRYEGRYGVADVHRAVDEADRQGVHVFAVALDQRARQHLPKMFGAGGFAVVTRPRDLVTAVGRLYQQRLAR